MNLKKRELVQKTFRMELTLWNKIVEYAEGTDFRSENELYTHLIETGLEALSQKPHIEPDIEASPDPNIEPPAYDQVTEGYKPPTESKITLVPPKKEDPEQKKEEQTEETVSQYSKKLFEFDTKEFKF